MLQHSRGARRAQTCSTDARPHRGDPSPPGERSTLRCHVIACGSNGSAVDALCCPLIVRSFVRSTSLEGAWRSLALPLERRCFLPDASLGPNASLGSSSGCDAPFQARFAAGASSASACPRLPCTSPISWERPLSQNESCDWHCRTSSASLASSLFSSASSESSRFGGALGGASLKMSSRVPWSSMPSLTAYDLKP